MPSGEGEESWASAVGVRIEARRPDFLGLPPCSLRMLSAEPDLPRNLF